MILKKINQALRKLLNVMNLIVAVQSLKYKTSCCLKCNKNTENKNSRILKTKNDKTLILSK